MTSAGSIPGIPGASEPTYYTRDRRFIPMDQIVVELCNSMGEGIGTFDTRVVKAVIQGARQLVCDRPEVDADDLAQEVCQLLRASRILLFPRHVESLLTAYGELVLELEITGVMESEAI